MAIWKIAFFNNEADQQPCCTVVASGNNENDAKSNALKYVLSDGQHDEPLILRVLSLVTKDDMHESQLPENDAAIPVQYTQRHL